MLTPRIKVVKFLCSGAILCTLLVDRAPAQKLEWIKPSLAGVPPARCCAPAAYDAEMGSTLLFGGATYSTTYDDTWEFSKATGWRQLHPAVSPSPTSNAGMAYDPTTKTVVLFGGAGSNGDSNQTWTWDGVTWTQQFPPVSPPARHWNTNGLVFDSAISRVVMFGGFTTNFVIMDDTWEWDGINKTWTEKFPVHSPSPRSAALAYDESAEQVVLFGGLTAQFAFTGDTWTYNGVDWVQHQTTTTPPARTDNAIAFDPKLGRVVMFGGLEGPCEDCGETRLNDTWVWGGVNWTQLQTPLTPAPSSGTSFTYDATVNGMVLFGGWISDSAFTSNTWLFELL